MAPIDDLRREIAETKTVLGSVKVLLANLAQRLRDALGRPNSDAEIAALAAELDAEQASLAQAITDNTVAENEPTPPAPGGEV